MPCHYMIYMMEWVYVANVKKILHFIMISGAKMMIKYKMFEVEIGTNGHIKYNGEIIAVLGSWNRYEDLEDDILDGLSENLH